MVAFQGVSQQSTDISSFCLKSQLNLSSLKFRKLSKTEFYKRFFANQLSRNSTTISYAQMLGFAKVCQENIENAVFAQKRKNRVCLEVLPDINNWYRLVRDQSIGPLLVNMILAITRLSPSIGLL